MVFKLPFGDRAKHFGLVFGVVSKAGRLAAGRRQTAPDCIGASPGTRLEAVRRLASLSSE